MGWLYVIQYIIIRFTYIAIYILFVEKNQRSFKVHYMCKLQRRCLWLSKAGSEVSSEIHASAIKKLKKLNCNFIVLFDRFPATFVAAKLFVTVALSSHCCRATCEHTIASTRRHTQKPILWECELAGTFSLWPLFSWALEVILSESNEYSSELCRNHQRNKPRKCNWPTGSFLTSA